MYDLNFITLVISNAATAVASPLTGEIVKDAYTNFKTWFSAKYSSFTFTEIEKKPDSEIKQNSLKEDLTEIQADKDQDLLEQVQILSTALSQIPQQTAQAIGIKLEDIKAKNLNIAEIHAEGEQAAGLHIKNSDFEGDINIGKVNVSATKK